MSSNPAEFMAHGEIIAGNALAIIKNRAVSLGTAWDSHTGWAQSCKPFLKYSYGFSLNR